MGLAILLLLLAPATPGSAVVLGHGSGAGLYAVDRIIRRVTVKWTYDLEPGRTMTCSGVQIDPRTILTAAHCLQGSALESIRRGRSFIEAYDESAPGQRRRLQVESAESTLDASADFAIVRVRGDLPSRESVPLAWGGCDRTSQFIQAGFGTSAREKDARSVNIALYGQAHPEREKALRADPSFDQKRIILDPLTTARACQGDSGGPVFCVKDGRLALYGVTNAIVDLADDQTVGNLKNQCLNNTRELTVTRVSDGMAAIERLRARTNLPDLPGATPSEPGTASAR